MGRKRSTRPTKTQASKAPTSRPSSRPVKQTPEHPKPLYKEVKPKTIGQSTYLKAINNSIITFGLGPAGTGKTFLAVAAAAEALMNGQITKIVLVRPAVEAGENLGFLPGDMAEKINPYLRPLFDSLNDIIDPKVVKELVLAEVIEIAPLAFMRGRTLKNAMIILDEAQNCTASQMKMFLTRIGMNSKVVITGDPSQNDLPYDKISGLVDAVSKVSHIKGISIIRLDKTDIVRHPIVQEIVDAYY